MRKVASLILSLSLAAATVWMAGGAVAEESVQEKLDRARAGQQSAEDVLAAAEARLRQTLDEFQRLRLDLDRATQDVVSSYALQESTATELAAAQESLNERVTAAYELGPAAAIDMFLGAQSPSDFASVQIYAANTFQVDDASVTEVARLKTEQAGLIAKREADERRMAAQVARVQKLAEDAAAQQAAASRAAKAAGLAVKKLEEEQRALEEARAAAAASLAKFLGSGGIGSTCATGTVHDLIVDAFAPLGQDQVNTALAVATRESNCRPNAWNPIVVPPYGNAAGVFQILYPGIWEAWSKRCGRAGESPFDPEANVAVAACTVADQGWWPWGF